MGAVQLVVTSVFRFVLHVRAFLVVLLCQSGRRATQLSELKHAVVYTRMVTLSRNVMYFGANCVTGSVPALHLQVQPV